jgi:hypothetical protein
MNSEILQIKIYDKIISIQKKDAIIFKDLHQDYNEYSKTDKYNLF